MSNVRTVTELLDSGADDAVALAAPDRRPMSYAAFRQHIEKTINALNGLGIGRNDPVAIVLANGPEMASAFISIAAGATTAPLNPTYKQEELEFYLADLSAKLLVTEGDASTPARKAAAKLGLPVAELRPMDDGSCGSFDLLGEKTQDAPQRTGPAQADDIALVLHTSGTTSRPKIVPLSHANVCASAANIRETLSLVPEDRCLNVMPLFHIHGLIAAVSATLGAGAWVFCTPGFNALKFFAWMKEAHPTWYTAVPTMHQAILSRAPRNREIIESVGLRLIRSSSASLPPQVMKDLEETF